MVIATQLVTQLEAAPGGIRPPFGLSILPADDKQRRQATAGQRPRLVSHRFLHPTLQGSAVRADEPTRFPYDLHMVHTAFAHGWATSILRRRFGLRINFAWISVYVIS